MKNVMQLKAMINKLARSNNIPPQAVLSMYLFERLLERISLSKYKDKFILKGGILVSSIVGINQRTTMDMDATLKRFPFNEHTIRSAVEEICAVETTDRIKFTVVSIGAIRKDDEYGGFRLALEAASGKLKTPLKIDVTTNDVITPKEVVFKYRTIFGEQTLDVYAYNIETVLAEKFETIVRRGKFNTRARDYYDIYILMKTQGGNIGRDILKRAIAATAEKRESVDALTAASDRICEISADQPSGELWKNYQKSYSYASGIEFNQIINVLEEISKICE